MAVDALGLPLRVVITDGTTADCTQAIGLLEFLSGEYVLADKGYDSQEIVDFIKNHGMIPVIPPRSSRKDQRQYDKDIYKIRHKIENTFRSLKEWRGVATRYAKNIKSFIAIIQIRCMVLWAKISI
jgi:transposase